MEASNLAGGRSHRLAQSLTRPGQSATLGALLGALAVVYLVWGSTYLAIRVAIDSIPPLLMSGTRFLLAGVLVYAWSARRGDVGLDRPTRRHWLSALVVGGLMFAGGNGGVTLGEQHISSGIVALLVATLPIWLTLFARVFLGERLSGPGLAGIAIGFVGVAVLLRPGTPGTASLMVMLLMLLSPICWSAGSLYARHAPLPRRPAVGNGMEMICGGALLVAGGVALGEPARLHLSSMTSLSVLAYVYLVVFGSIIAFTAYMWLLRVSRTPVLATYAYANPLVAVLLGSAFLAEPLSWSMGLAAVLILASVALTSIVPGRAR
ncbi:MAG: EamA family transporter [Candidatus Dormibacteria bacterium]